jgi:hypothetical protein
MIFFVCGERVKIAIAIIENAKQVYVCGPV